MLGRGKLEGLFCRDFISYVIFALIVYCIVEEKTKGSKAFHVLEIIKKAGNRTIGLAHKIG